MQKTTKECTFSIELKSKEKLKTVKVANGNHQGVLIEGSIGQLQSTGFIEDIVLEVIGKEGIFRIDLSPQQIGKINMEVEEK